MIGGAYDRIGDGPVRVRDVPVLRITSPAEFTDRVVDRLRSNDDVTEIAVVPGASRVSGGDLVIVEVLRAGVDDVIAHLPDAESVPGLHVSIEESEQLLPDSTASHHDDDEDLVWTQVVKEVHGAGHLSWLNVVLIVVAASIAAVGIVRDQLLLIVGAMALSPDYFPIADTSLSFVVGDWVRARRGLMTLVVGFGAGAIGAWLLTEVLQAADVVNPQTAPTRQLTLFISEPGTLSVLVALLAGIAGALAVTLPGTRGLVGVFVSVTTIPAAANMGVAIAARDGSELLGAGVQLLVNVVCLIAAGAVTLKARRRLAR